MEQVGDFAVLPTLEKSPKVDYSVDSEDLWLTAPDVECAYKPDSRNAAMRVGTTSESTPTPE